MKEKKVPMYEINVHNGHEIARGSFSHIQSLFNILPIEVIYDSIPLYIRGTTSF